MTGEKDKFKTHEQLWKLEDGELSTPQHDELVLQLLNPKNAVKMYSLILDEEVDEYRMNIQSELPITTKTEYIIGYIDVVLEAGRTNPNIFVEAKPKIKSFGETLRQIRTYMNYRNFNVRYVIYSPDTRFKAAFESQGIRFVTPSDIGIKM
jgi:hypothetical protein